MEIVKALNESFAYAKDSIWGLWKRWIILTIMYVIFPFILGYMMEIYRGTTPAPEPENWGRLFVDGLKFLLVGIIYAIPVIIIGVASFLPLLMSIFSKMGSGGEFTMDLPTLTPFFLPILGGLLLAVIVGIVITLISSIGVIRMARVGGIREAFNFSAILETIRAIGWGSYIFAIIVIFVVTIVVSLVFSLIELIPYIGFIISLFLGVILTVFESRFMTLIYESSEN
ncbi:MAG: hypothetical protein CVV33_02405 [Methanomicrobiales archaeon HGW-Methanomicrobiales-4]|nr:MAG: hypothetical protein CVV33_02405 [Methanomicrobiales archaeon HGW-Methanomicrobiales-4]